MNGREPNIEPPDDPFEDDDQWLEDDETIQEIEFPPGPLCD